jgi:peptidoglycan hydrolase-like protein with peptidoglycan-binding domain
MICNPRFWKNIGLSIILMGGMSIMQGPAQARTLSSPVHIISAQKRLAAKGYYRGPINGRMNRRTRRALADFQFDHNLAETGRLNPRTCKMLGASCAIPIKR